MSVQFNFSGLRDVYLQALKSPDKSLAFDVVNGRGHFLFMMFLSDEDEDMKDALFIYMRNTKRLLQFKTYGSHRNGNFTVYINDQERGALIRELKLQGGTGEFDFERFLEELNAGIPTRLNQAQKVEMLQEGIKHVPSIVDESLKSILVGPRRLTKGTPRDKTLRKLYLYTDYDSDEVDRLIDYLKATNMTVAWTTPDKADKAADIFTELGI